MTTYVDEKFIRLIANQLKNFKQKGPRLWTFSCPICGDSIKKQHKTRGYFFYNAKYNSYFFKCHNCSDSKNLFSFLKEIDTSLYRQYVLETFANKVIIEPKFSPVIVSTNNIQDIKLESLSVLHKDHWVIEYIKNRKIPEKFWNELYYAPDYNEFIKILIPNDDRKSSNDPRLIIPIYDENLNLQGINARALKTNAIKYISRKISEDSIKCYGLHRIDKSQKVYVFEGPIDSMFVVNSVATCDSDIMRSAKYIPKENLVLVFDNQYYNLEIRRNIIKAIDEGFNICILPKAIQEKDINEMIMNGYSINKVKQLIDDNTFNKTRAMLELCNR